MNPKRKIIYDKFGGKCAYCGVDLQKIVWHIDHIKPIIRCLKTGKATKPENDNNDNKFPACASCNINKHGMSIEEFRDAIKKYVASLNNYSTQYKIAKRYNLIFENDIPVVFYFEKPITQ